MYVCICNAVTDKQIKKAAASGVDNLYELREKLGVSSACGSCADHASAILEEANASYAQPSLYIPSAS